MRDRIPYLALAGAAPLALALHFAIDPFGLTHHGAIAVFALVLALAMLLFRADCERRLAEGARRETAELGQLHLSSMTELRDRMNWLRMTETLAHVGHWRLNLADDSLFWSEETYAIHGRSPADPPKLDEAIQAYHEDDRAKVAQAVEHARETGRPYSFRARLIRPDGEIRYVEAVAKTELDEMGETAALFGVFADRTDEFRMRQALVEAGDRAFAAANAKSTFLATMSHEIRVPMNGLVGFADRLLQSELPSPERQLAEKIAESARAMTLLLNDILDISKIEAGEAKVKQEPTDIAQIVGEVARMVEPQAREKGLELAIGIDPSVPRSCLTDPLRLRQLLSNLTGNTIKFTERGVVSLQAECREGALIVVVRNGGDGIAGKDRDRIFDALARADSAPDHQANCPGLGLAIARQLAELLGGTVTLDGGTGRGRSFAVSVPVTPVTPALPPGPSRKDDGTAVENAMEAGFRVLVAEDCDPTRMLVQTLADRAGIEVAMAGDGGTAVMMAEQAEAEGKPFAMVMMDLNMPDMDGFEAVRRLRAGGFDADRLPIVAMTAAHYPDDLERCLNAGMQAHLAKPLSIEDFRETVKTWSAAGLSRAA